MAVVSKEQLMSQIKNVLGDNTSDEAISLLENVSDTLDASSNADAEELKKQLAEAQKKAEEIDKNWREKYTNRFNAPVPQPSTPVDPSGEGEDEEEEEEEPKTFSDLFSTDN
jgi:hypothetical protein